MGFSLGLAQLVGMERQGHVCGICLGWRPGGAGTELLVGPAEEDGASLGAWENEGVEEGGEVQGQWACGGWGGGGEGDAQAGISGQDWRALSAALRLRDFGQARPLSHLGWLDPLVHWARALLVSALLQSLTKGWL